MEFPHLMRLIEENQFDTIYHEHFSYFSFLTVSARLRGARAAVFDVEELPTHGGSLRIYACHADDAGKPETDASRELRERERAAGFEPLETYLGFGRARAAGQAPVLDFLIELEERRASASSATARRRRATRCSTTAASAPTSSTTPSTAARTSRAASCPGTTSRSARRSRSRETGPTSC